MADHLTEEEQIEALKGWWNEYWKSVVVPIAFALAAYTGWNYWQDQKLHNAQMAGAKYEELLSSMSTSPDGKLDDTQRAKAEVIAKEILSDFSGTLYSDHANLILARLSIDSKDLATAVNYLQQVSNDGSNEAMKALAAGRLARVKVALGAYDEALSLVSSSSDPSYQSLYAEVRGDALAAQGKKDAAKTAYQNAVDNLDSSQYSRRSILQMKIDGVDILTGQVAAPESVSSENTGGEAGTKEPEGTPVNVNVQSAENS